MKKLTILLVVGLMAAPATAGLVDGGFTAQTITRLTETSGGAADGVGDFDTSYDRSEFDDNIEWMQSDNHWEISATGGQSGAFAWFDGTAGRWLSQTWLDNSATTGTGWELSFYVNVTDADAGAILNVAVVGLDSPWHGSWDDQIGHRVHTTAGAYPLVSEGSGRTGVAVLDTSVDVTGAMGWTKFTFSGIDLGTGYDHLSIGFGADTVDTDLDVVIGIDTVTFTPEPATMALLAFGGIGMLIRRKR